MSRLENDWAKFMFQGGRAILPFTLFKPRPIIDNTGLYAFHTCGNVAGVMTFNGVHHLANRFLVDPLTSLSPH
jgi:hypothetical protein